MTSGEAPIGPTRTLPVMLDCNLTALENLCRCHGIVALFLFGSRARGTHRSDSDYDIAYLAPHGQDPVCFEVEILRLLAEELGVDEICIDLQNLREGTPLFRVRVCEEGHLLFCSDTTELARFHAGSVSASRDRQFYMRPFREAMRQRIKEGRFAS